MPALLLLLALAQAPVSACGIAEEAAFATTKEQPVRVGGGAVTVAARERRYLDVLRGPTGEPVQYKRLGSERTDDRRTILDRYEVTYPGLEKPIFLYLDAYHFDDALNAPKGFTCAAPIALGPPPPDPFLAMDAMLVMAIDHAGRDIPPVSLDTDGSSTHGVLFDRYRRQVRAAKAAAAAGAPLNPRDPARGASGMGMLVVAYPLRCGEKPPVPAAAVEIVPAQGAIPRHGPLAGGDAVAPLLPGVSLPAGAVAAEFELERPRPTDAIKIVYPDSGCGGSNEISLPMQYTAGRLVNAPQPTLPEGQTTADRAVYLQAMIDVDGTVQQVSYVGGPTALAPAAIAAVREWAATPAKLNGSPIVTAAMLQVRFKPR